MTTPYAERKIDLTFQIGSGGNPFKLSGLRVEARIEKVYIPAPALAQVKVYGLSLLHINQLTRAGKLYKASIEFNGLLIEAGDSKSGMTTVFNGQIQESYPDFKGPNSALQILATPIEIIKLKPVEPSSFKGPTDAVQALKVIAAKAGLTVEDNGVSVKLASPYFSGTAWSQIISLVRATNVFAVLDGATKVLAIWPKTGSRSGAIPIISPETGMIGYPEFENQVRLRVRTLFDPTVKYKDGPGQKITVKSQLDAANGSWVIDQIDYNLASQTPGGAWEMTLISHAPGEE